MPNIHPLFVHFPIALLTMSFLFDAIGLATKRVELLRTGWWSLAAGTVGLLATVVSGLRAEQSLVISTAAREYFETHEQIAFLVAGMYALLFLWRVANRTHLPAKREWFFVGGSFIGVVALWLGAWYGGELVFRFGVGVQLP
jgi:uncharacterized membrane protein